MIRNRKKTAAQNDTIQIKHKDGILRHVEVSALEIKAEGGNIEWQITLLHITDRKNANGRPTGAEALIHWQHPERGMVSPYHFISLAEKRG